jgi:L-ribulokinase
MKKYVIGVDYGSDSARSIIAETLGSIIPKLSKEAMNIYIEESTIVALDWMNGRPTPDANQEVKGAIVGLTFGSKAIVDRFTREGIEIKEIIGLGGVAKKSPFVRQTLADVLNMPIKIATTEQTCAFGAAMFAATVGGVYKNVEEAQKAMGKGFEKTYYPQPALHKQYMELYEKYNKLGIFINDSIT